MTQHSTKTAGIDTGKKRLTLGFWPPGERHSVANDATGIASLAAILAKHGIKRLGIESTSIYHVAASDALASLGFEVAVLQPGQVKAFAKLQNIRAKSDRGDAELVAGCAGSQRRVRAPHSTKIKALAEHLTFIEQCEDNAARLKTQLERFTNKTYIRQIKRQIAAIRLMVRRELKALEKELRCDALLARRLDLAVSVPGVGIRSALAALIRMPELGSISREEAAALLGVAPIDDDSEGHQGIRFIQGGRARARKSLFMAALNASLHYNPVLRAFYKRLIARGKPHTLALTACTRKLVIILNAVLARGSKWVTHLHRKPSEGMPCPQ
jgi:transposase